MREILDAGKSLWKKKMEPGFVMIYALVDSRDQENIRYIGQTRRPYQRLWEHKNESRRGKNRNLRNNWITSVVRSGADVILRPLSIVPETEAHAEESKWLAKCAEFGFPLKNGTDFTDVRYPSESARKEIGKKTAGKWADPEHRKFRLNAMKRPESIGRMSNSLRALWADEKFRNKILAIRSSKEIVDKHHAATSSEEYKKKISETSKRAWKNAESRAARIEAITKSLRRPETRKKLSETRKNFLNQEGVREGLSKKLREIWGTDEARKRQSERATAQWARRKQLAGEKA